MDAEGYREIFRAEHDGLYASHEQRLFEPSALEVDQRARVEYDSNPDEEAIVFALRDPKSNLRGTFTVTFGPNIDALDAGVVELLK